MFQSLKKRVVDEAKETVKEEVIKAVDKKMPLLIGLAGALLSAYIVFESGSTKRVAATSTTTIINNYYIYGGKK